MCAETAVTNNQERSSQLPLDREPISAFVICFNEEEYIAECLRSLSFCDEIFVIDSFSTDRTVEIAQSMGAKVLQRPWSGYRDQKAFGLTQVSHEWVMNLDADEQVSPELRENVLRVMRERRALIEKTGSAPDIAGYYITRVVYYLGRWWRSGGWYPEYRLRLFRREKVVWGGVEPHEKPLPQGKTEILGGEIYHFTYKSIDEQILQLHRFSTIAAAEEYRAGRRAGLVSLLLNPIVRMVKFFFVKRGYREGMAGFIVAGFEGFYAFMKYAKIWEHGYNERRREE